MKLWVGDKWFLTYKVLILPYIYIYIYIYIYSESRLQLIKIQLYASKQFGSIKRLHFLYKACIIRGQIFFLIEWNENFYIKETLI